MTAIALLRAVGHISDKQDTKINKYYRVAMDEAYTDLQKLKPEPRIYWEFSDAERNNILKVYEFGTKGVITFRPGTTSINLSTGEQIKFGRITGNHL